MKAIGIFFVSLMGLALILGLTWVIQGNDFFLTRYFSPKYEDVRRETYEHSHAYNAGMVQELENMQFEYIKADAPAKAALRSVILHRVDDYGEDKLPGDLRRFVQDIRREQREGQ